MLRYNLISLGVIGAGALVTTVISMSIAVHAERAITASEVSYELTCEQEVIETVDEGREIQDTFMFTQRSWLSMKEQDSAIAEDAEGPDEDFEEDISLNITAPEQVKFSAGFEIEEYADTYTVQINKGYDIPAEFYFDTLPASMHPIVESVCELEKSSDISSMFLIAVAATEVGWGEHFYEKNSNNWFNWTADTIDYQWFDSAEDCIGYTGEKFKERFFNPDWYAEYGQSVDDYFIVSEVNTRYALIDADTVNWEWTEVVVEIMYSLNSKYQVWKEAKL